MGDAHPTTTFTTLPAELADHVLALADEPMLIKLLRAGERPEVVELLLTRKLAEGWPWLFAGGGGQNFLPERYLGALFDWVKAEPPAARLSLRRAVSESINFVYFMRFWYADADTETTHAIPLVNVAPYFKPEFGGGHVLVRIDDAGKKSMDWAAGVYENVDDAICFFLHVEGSVDVAGEEEEFEWDAGDRERLEALREIAREFPNAAARSYT